MPMSEGGRAAPWGRAEIESCLAASSQGREGRKDRTGGRSWGPVGSGGRAHDGPHREVPPCPAAGRVSHALPGWFWEARPWRFPGGPCAPALGLSRPRGAPQSIRASARSHGSSGDLCVQAGFSWLERGLGRGEGDLRRGSDLRVGSSSVLGHPMGEQRPETGPGQDRTGEQLARSSLGRKRGEAAGFCSFSGPRFSLNHREMRGYRVVCGWVLARVSQHP